MCHAAYLMTHPRICTSWARFTVMGQLPVLLGFVCLEFWTLPWYCSPYRLCCSSLVAKLQLNIPAVVTTSLLTGLNMMPLIVHDLGPNWHPLLLYLRHIRVSRLFKVSCCDCCSNPGCHTKSLVEYEQLEGPANCLQLLGLKDRLIGAIKRSLSVQSNWAQGGEQG